MSRNDWLYPLSDKAGTWFEDPTTGNWVGVSFKSFRDLVVPGKIKDHEWYLSTNYRKVAVGDRIWVYIGPGDIGVVGLATVTGIDPDGPDHAIKLNFNIKACKQLCAKPFPADRVRTYISHARGAVQAMEPHPKFVRELEAWAGI